MSELEQLLESSRKELLDLGMRNSLLNHRKKAKQIVIIEEKSKEIFKILVEDGKAMTFDPLPDKRENEFIDVVTDSTPVGTDSIIELSQPDIDLDVVDREALYTDSKLQTTIVSDKLQAKLLSVHNDARTSIEEQGINILYIALGFLYWYQDENSNEPRRAPLILVPIVLDRSSAQSRFQVKHSGDDIGDNLSLIEKFKSEFGINLPKISEDDNTVLDLEQYYEDVGSAVKSRWYVRPDEMTVGFFSFGKFLMYQDLSPENWNEENSNNGLRVMNSLLVDGFNEGPDKFTDDTHIDEILSPADVHQVLDADSSQILAIQEILAGRNLVVQGPPGTGKSQTITNLIAEFIGNGKKVLFVSEKMAALDVVKRRLDAIGIGDAVLELHSHKTNKKIILEEVKRTLSLGKPKPKDNTDDIERLTLLRDQLNEYCEAINKPIGNSKMNFINSLGHAIKCNSDEMSSPLLDFNHMSDWSNKEFKNKRSKIEELDRHLELMGSPADNPFFACKLTEFLPSQKKELTELLQKSSELTNELMSTSKNLAEFMGVEAPEKYNHINKLGSLALKISKSPDLEKVNINPSDWEEHREAIKITLKACEALVQTHKQYDLMLIDAAWDYNLIEIRQHFMTLGNKWWKFLSGKFRGAKSELQGLMKKPLPKKTSDIIPIIDALMDSQKNRAVLEENQTKAQLLFGKKWKSLESDLSELNSITEWMVEFHRGVTQGMVPESVFTFANSNFDRSDLRRKTDKVQKCYKEHQIACKESAVFLKLNVTEESRSHWNLTLQNQARYLKNWLNDFEKLTHQVRLNNLQKIFEDSGLGFVLPVLESWKHEAGKLLNIFDYSWYQGLVETAYITTPCIKMFDKTNHESKIKEFSRLDRLLFRHNRLKLISLHWEKLPNISGAGEIGIINSEMNKKRRHLPIRKLIQKAGNALLSIKPVFMMSPMSIATYIPPSSVEFDLVVFDEASQVKPVDAFGAMLRGSQVVVVGDSKQLPPTSFFDTLTAVEQEDEEEENVADLESVLSLFLAKGAPSKMLRWHYRSKHDSLIAFSNQEFYDNKLMIFPSSGMQSEAKGLVFKHQPDTAYDRGKTRTNPEEAKIVANAVMEHAREYPEQTLGVVAFSMAQRDAVEAQLEVLRREDASCEPFFSENEAEPFFIKNLENVQGDERDVIFISIGYGRTAEGYMTMSFGPLNRDGGERRLNVLITRSRMSMVVYSNFTSKDIDTQRTKAIGVISLKNFLAFAETGIIDQPYSTGKETDSPFEDEVIKVLVQNGIDVEPQVGTSGFFIDIGVKDPNFPGRFILGIECDGATYHSSRSARDRDRLRQDVLENLGWNIYRIWSTDWYINREKETERLLLAIRNRQDAVDSGIEQPIEIDEEEEDPQAYKIERTDDDKENVHDVTVPYRQETLDVRLDGADLHEMPPEEILKYIKKVVITESPVHQDVIVNRITEGAGLNRAGNRIRSVIEKAVRVGLIKGDIRREGNFMWEPDMSIPPIRNRADAEGAARKYENIAPEELRIAMHHVVTTSYSISQDQIITETVRLLGFQRITSKSRELFVDQIEFLINDGQLQLKNDLYMVSSK